MKFNRLEVDEQFDGDEELEFNMDDDSFTWLTRSQVEDLRDYLTSILEAP